MTSQTAMRVLATLFCLTALGATACSGDDCDANSAAAGGAGSGGASRSDAGPDVAEDAASNDATSPDGDSRDSSAQDSATQDSDVSDSAARDGSSTDASSTDGSSGDATPSDSSTRDGAVPNSCQEISSTDCFSNYDCKDTTQRCDNVGTKTAPLACCVTGVRGTKKAGEPCTDSNECESGVCIAGHGKQLCSGTCHSAQDCPDGMKDCRYVMGSHSPDDWCFPTR